MDHARNKKLWCSLILLILAGCSRKPEEQLVRIIEDKYANLYVNDERSKREALKELKIYLKDHPINDQNITEIKSRIHKINDGHVVLFDDRPEKNKIYGSTLKFVLGSHYVQSCETCTPALKPDKYEILEVNKLSLKDYMEKEKYSVAASTPWGRHYRILRSLVQNNERPDITLKLLSSTGKEMFTTLRWKELPNTPPVCVSGERLEGNIYKVNILNLWCEDTTVKKPWTRDEIYNNFKKQFDEVMASATGKDKIVIDLRENGGGGDMEVEYILNAFNEKSVFMYRYKYLRKTHPGKRKWLERFWPFKLDLWAKEEFEYTNLDHRPKKTFFDNKAVTLISAGCFSSCETIASSLKLEKRATVIGQRTHGGSGDPVIFAIKGTHFSVNLPTCVTWQENGRFYEGSGVHPDTEVVQNPKVVSDNVLAKAIDLVR